MVLVSLLNLNFIIIIVMTMLGCAGQTGSSMFGKHAGDFEVADERFGRVVEKKVFENDAAWRTRTNRSSMPVGWTSGNFLMDGLITYLHTSMSGSTFKTRTGSTYAYVIEIPDDDRFQVLSRFSGFDIGECVKILFGKAGGVRVTCGDSCP
jgi:hypothetical protein